MAKILTKKTRDKYDLILSTSSIHKEKDKLTYAERIELKSHAIFTKVKKQRYVRN